MVTRPALGPLEVRVLGVLGGEPASVGAVRERLARESTPLAYTTVMTVLTRLYRKGIVARSREGNRYLYSPSPRGPRLLEGMFAGVRRALLRTSRAPPLLALLEEEELSADELRSLRQAIDRKLEEKKR